MFPQVIRARTNRSSRGMPVTAVALLLAVACAHPGAGRMREAPSVESFEPAAALALTATPAPVAAGVAVTFHLRNLAKDRSLWVNRRARVGENDQSEIRVTLIDGRARRVQERCTDDLPTPRSPADFGTLAPGDEVTVVHRFDAKCWSFAPGEVLQLMATFRFLAKLSPPAPEGAAVEEGVAATPGWLRVEVPKDWPDHFSPR
jgi:hypothetical protein